MKFFTCKLLLILFITGFLCSQGKQEALAQTKKQSVELSFLEHSCQLLSTSEYDDALKLATKFLKTTDTPGLSIAARYADIVSYTETKENYGKATSLYLSALENSEWNKTNITALIKEYRYFSLLLGGDEISESEIRESPKIIADLIKSNWQRFDPTPSMEANQRFIEHRLRIRHALNHFPDSESDIGVDDRGKLIIRYGEPDQITNLPSSFFKQGELYDFMVKYQDMLEGMQLTESGSDDSPATDADTASDNFTIVSSASSGTSAFDLRRRTNDLIDTIHMDPFHTNLEIWIYNRFDGNMRDNLVFYLTERENNVYRTVQSLDDWIPRSLYRASDRGFGGGFSPSLPLQYFAYQRIMHLDRQFMGAYDNIQNQIFNQSYQRSREQLLRMAANIRNKHRLDVIERQRSAPAENSTEKNKIPEIPLNIYQYRTLGSNGEPVFTTFIESRPTTAFLMDFITHEELMYGGDNFTEQLPDNFYKYYGLQHGVHLFNSQMEPRGRLRDHPVLEVENEQEFPAVSIATVPLIEEGAIQQFYAKLLNYHPDTDPANESLFPDELRGLTTENVAQPQHLTLNENTLVLSDLITGYNRVNHSRARFPFRVNHQRKVPAGENLVIHFELFGLTPDDSGFTRFEINYIFEPNQRFSFFRSSRNLQGVLEFSTNDTWFKESLEFDNISLRKGWYDLTWIITDLVSEQTVTTEIQLHVVDEVEVFALD